jgi:hypothetical protein
MWKALSKWTSAAGILMYLEDLPCQHLKDSMTLITTLRRTASIFVQKANNGLILGFQVLINIIKVHGIAEYVHEAHTQLIFLSI